MLSIFFFNFKKEIILILFFSRMRQKWAWNHLRAIYYLSLKAFTTKRGVSCKKNAYLVTLVLCYVKFWKKKIPCQDVKSFLCIFSCWFQIWNPNLKICAVFFLNAIFKILINFKKFNIWYFYYVFNFHDQKLIPNKKVFMQIFT